MHHIWYFLTYPINFHLFFNVGWNSRSPFHDLPGGSQPEIWPSLGLTDKDTWSHSPPLSYLLANPRTISLGANCFGVNSTGWFVPNTLWTPQLLSLMSWLDHAQARPLKLCPTVLKTGKTKGTEPFPSGIWSYRALYLSRKEKVRMFYIWVNLIEEQMSHNCFSKS